MSSADARGGRPADELERRLEQALSLGPSPDRAAAMDARVARTVALGRPGTMRTGARALGGRWPGRLVAVALAAALLMGAAIAVSRLEQAAALMPGWQVAYDRGERIRAPRTVGDYTVTLERAWADPNQLVLAFTASGPSGAVPAVVRGTVVDDAGRHFLEFAGGDVPDFEASVAATIAAYDVPIGVGDVLRLHVRVDDLVPVSTEPLPARAGPWRWDVSVPLRNAVTVATQISAAENGITVTLDSVRFSPTAIRVAATADLSGVMTDRWRRWVPTATIRRADGDALADGDPLPLEWSPFPSAWTGQPKQVIGPILDAADGSEIVLQTTSGEDDPTGTWIVEIERFTGFDGAGATTVVEGSWVLPVDVP